MQKPTLFSLSKLLLTLWTGTAALQAADFHASPQGAGNKDGSSAANAAPASAISEIFNTRLQPGDRLLLEKGDYPDLSLSLSTGGAAGKPKTIEGEGAVFSSTWTIEKPDKGATAITLAPGLSDVVFKNLSIRNYCFAIRAGAAKETPRLRLSFEGIAIEQVRHGFYLSDCDEMTLSDCKLKRYSKHGFRFDQGCDKVTLRHCSADCSEGDAVWETKTEVFPFGFILNDSGTPNSAFLLEDCVAKNNIKSNQTVKYTNGDGFVVEANARDVSFKRCHAFRNQDGGFDLKVKDVALSGCISTGHRRDYRIWTTGTLENCFGGWSTTGLWAKTGPVTVTRSTFLGHRKFAVEMEDGALAPVSLVAAIIASDGGNPEYRPTLGKVELGDTVTTTPAGAGFTKPDPAWNGEGNALDSVKYPDKGFSAARAAR